jgi:hypothetical protein
MITTPEIDLAQIEAFAQRNVRPAQPLNSRVVSFLSAKYIEPFVACGVGLVIHCDVLPAPPLRCTTCVSLSSCVVDQSGFIGGMGTREAPKFLQIVVSFARLAASAQLSALIEPTLALGMTGEVDGEDMQLAETCAPSGGCLGGGWLTQQKFFARNETKFVKFSADSSATSATLLMRMDEYGNVPFNRFLRIDFLGDIKCSTARASVVDAPSVSCKCSPENQNALVPVAQPTASPTLSPTRVPSRAPSRAPTLPPVTPNTTSPSQSPTVVVIAAAAAAVPAASNGSSFPVLPVALGVSAFVVVALGVAGVWCWKKKRGDQWKELASAGFQSPKPGQTPPKHALPADQYDPFSLSPLADKPLHGTDKIPQPDFDMPLEAEATAADVAIRVAPIVSEPLTPADPQPLIRLRPADDGAVIDDLLESAPGTEPSGVRSSGYLPSVLDDRPRRAAAHAAGSAADGGPKALVERRPAADSLNAVDNSETIKRLALLKEDAAAQHPEMAPQLIEELKQKLADANHAKADVESAKAVQSSLDMDWDSGSEGEGNREWAAEEHVTVDGPSGLSTSLNVQAIDVNFDDDDDDDEPLSGSDVSYVSDAGPLPVGAHQVCGPSCRRRVPCSSRPGDRVLACGLESHCFRLAGPLNVHLICAVLVTAARLPCAVARVE